MNGTRLCGEVHMDSCQELGCWEAMMRKTAIVVALEGGYRKYPDYI